MLAAIGRGRDSIYLAALSPVRTPTGTIGEAEAARLAEIARHHIGLAAPKALLLFGDACGKALVGSAVAGARARWHEVSTGGGADPDFGDLPARKAADPAEAQSAGLGRSADADGGTEA